MAQVCVCCGAGNTRTVELRNGAEGSLQVKPGLVSLEIPDVYKFGADLPWCSRLVRHRSGLWRLWVRIPGPEFLFMDDNTSHCTAAATGQLGSEGIRHMGWSAWPWDLKLIKCVECCREMTGSTSPAASNDFTFVIGAVRGMGHDAPRTRQQPRTVHEQTLHILSRSQERPYPLLRTAFYLSSTYQIDVSALRRLPDRCQSSPADDGVMVELTLRLLIPESWKKEVDLQPECVNDEFMIPQAMQFLAKVRRRLRARRQNVPKEELATPPRPSQLAGGEGRCVDIDTARHLRCICRTILRALRLRDVVAAAGDARRDRPDILPAPYHIIHKCAPLCSPECNHLLTTAMIPVFWLSTSAEAGLPTPYSQPCLYPSPTRPSLVLFTPSCALVNFGLSQHPSSRDTTPVYLGRHSNAILAYWVISILVCKGQRLSPPPLFPSTTARVIESDGGSRRSPCSLLSSHYGVDFLVRHKRLAIHSRALPNSPVVQGMFPFGIPTDDEIFQAETMALAGDTQYFPLLPHPHTIATESMDVDFQLMKRKGAKLPAKVNKIPNQQESKRLRKALLVAPTNPVTVVDTTSKPTNLGPSGQPPPNSHPATWKKPNQRHQQTFRIVVPDTTKHNLLIHKLRAIRKDGFSLLHNRQGINFLATQLELHQDALQMLSANMIPHFSYSLASTAPQNMVFDLPASTDISDINQDLTSAGYNVQHIYQFKKRIPVQADPSKFSLESEPLVCVTAAQNTNLPPLHKVSKLTVTIVHPHTRQKRPQDVAQCRNCLALGHTNNFCSMPPSCPHCARSHPQNACTHRKEPCCYSRPCRPTDSPRFVATRFFQGRTKPVVVRVRGDADRGPATSRGVHCRGRSTARRTAACSSRLSRALRKGRERPPSRGAALTAARGAGELLREAGADLLAAAEARPLIAPTLVIGLVEAAAPDHPVVRLVCKHTHPHTKRYDNGHLQLLQDDTLQEDSQICKVSSTGNQQVMSSIPSPTEMGTVSADDYDEKVKAKDGMSAVESICAKRTLARCSPLNTDEYTTPATNKSTPDIYDQAGGENDREDSIYDDYDDSDSVEDDDYSVDALTRFFSEFPSTSDVNKAEDAENTDYMFTEVPNKLVDRLRLLDEQQCGDYSSMKEVASIIRELKERDYIRLCDELLYSENEISGRNCRAHSDIFDKPQPKTAEHSLSRAEDYRARPSWAEDRQPPSRRSQCGFELILRLRVRAQDVWALVPMMWSDNFPPTWANRALLPEGSLPDFRTLESCPDDAAGRRLFSVISCFPPPLYSGAAIFSPRFTSIGFQDLVVKSFPHLTTPHNLSQRPSYPLSGRGQHVDALVTQLSVTTTGRGKERGSRRKLLRCYNSRDTLPASGDSEVTGQPTRAEPRCTRPISALAVVEKTPSTWSFPPLSEAEKRWSSKGDTATRIKRPIAATRKALNLRAVFSSHCMCIWEFQRIDERLKMAGSGIAEVTSLHNPLPPPLPLVGARCPSCLRSSNVFGNFSRWCQLPTCMQIKSSLPATHSLPTLHSSELVRLHDANQPYAPTTPRQSARSWGSVTSLSSIVNFLH
ncbi:hypothetical protein PR048_023815 [Dryococelus australis]|uniref:Pre-C2HC domain-containing protein n=1 Tax=Dryococelus australis TaxID=614101 RepID=A0ABQ9GV38_9NEOP|nr:hypothetical protein PR048_023815 [Dryococelus australis]